MLYLGRGHLSSARIRLLLCLLPEQLYTDVHPVVRAHKTLNLLTVSCALKLGYFAIYSKSTSWTHPPSLATPLWFWLLSHSLSVPSSRLSRVLLLTTASGHMAKSTPEAMSQTCLWGLCCRMHTLLLCEAVIIVQQHKGNAGLATCLLQQCW